VCVLALVFDPVDLTTTKGTAVSFTAKTAITHNIVFDTPRAAGVDDIGIFSDGTVTRTFSTSGTFPYHCTIHGGVGTGMHGSIIVP
jgi:plastocyanin